MAADGSLNFDTKVNTDGFDGGITSLKGAIEKLTVTIERLSHNIVRAFDGAKEAVARTGARADQTAGQIDNIAESAERAEREAEALRRQMDSITITGLNDNDGAAIPSIESGQTQAIDREAEAMDDLRISAESARATLDTWHDNRLSLSLEEMAERAELARQKIEALESMGIPGDNATMQQAVADYDYWISEMGRAGGSIQTDQTPVTIPVELDPNSFESQINALKARLAELRGQGFTLGNSEYDSTYVQLQRVIQAENEYRRSLLETDSGQRQAEASARRMNRTMRDTRKAAVPLTKSIVKLSNMFKLMVIRMAMRSVIRGVQEGFQNLAQYSEGVNATLSELMSSLMYLKNSFATAFAPVLDIVVPALSAMIDAIASALAWLGQLIAALNGKSTFVKAKKTQEDYAAGLKKTGGAAKQAGKDAKKALAPFDELNMLTQKDQSAGGGGTSGTDPSQMFETVEIDKNVTSLIESMKGEFAKFLAWAQSNFGPSLAKVWDDMIPNIENFKGILAGIWSDMGSLADPLMEWFHTDFIAFLQQLILTGGDIVNGLFDSFNMVFSDIWNLSVFPFLENFVTVGLPMITQFGTEMIKTLGSVFEQVKLMFDTLWQDIAAPALKILTTIWTDCVDSLASVWNEFGTPIFEALREAIEKTGDTWKRIWDSSIKPVFDTFMDVTDRLWTGHIKPLLDHFLEFGARLIQVALDIYNQMILPLVSWFVDIFGPGISAGIQIVLVIFNAMSTVISGVIDTVLLVLNGLLDFIHMGFTDGWDKAWSSIGDIFKGVFNGIIQIAENAINFISDSLNSLSFDVPKWVPKIGGETFGFDVPTVKLPRLAAGTVVPPRAGEFAAILGDNNREAEVVSPLSTMKQALLEALVEAGGIGGDISLKVYLDGAAVYENVVSRNTRATSTMGQNPMLT